MEARKRRMLRPSAARMRGRAGRRWPTSTFTRWHRKLAPIEIRLMLEPQNLSNKTFLSLCNISFFFLFSLIS